MNSILIYILAINLVTFITFGIDKYKAKYHRWRVSEQMLLCLALLGGTIGAIIAMRLFHHKTKKPRFIAGVPVILILQIVLSAIYCYFNIDSNIKFF